MPSPEKQPQSARGGSSARQSQHSSSARGKPRDDDSPPKTARSGAETARSGAKSAKSAALQDKSKTDRSGQSPRSNAESGDESGEGDVTSKQKRGRVRACLRCPKCKCCMWTCPCMYCCHPDATLDRETVIRMMQGIGKNKNKAVNMALVEDQLRQDRERLQDHKRKWRRRWLVFCCCSISLIVMGATAAVLVLATNSWTLVTENCGWEARIHFGAIFTPEKRIIVAGGTNLVINMADVWSSEDRGESWSRVIDIANFGPRHGHALLHYPSPSSLLIIGGDGGSIGDSPPVPLQDVWKSTDGREWVLVTATAPWPPRKRFGAAIDSAGVIFILGGLGVFGISGLNDLWKSEDQGLTWSPISLSSPWSARHSFSFLRLPGGTREGRLLILGGFDGRAQHDVWASDDSGSMWHLMDFLHVKEMTWKNIENVASWSPRFGTGTTADNEGMITLCGGGTDQSGEDEFSREVWQIPSPPQDEVPWYLQKTKDPRLNRPKYPEQWKLQGKPRWTPRRYLQAFVDDEGTVHIIGGEDIEGLKNDLWKKKSSIDLKNLQDAYERTRSRAANQAGQEPEKTESAT